MRPNALRCDAIGGLYRFSAGVGRYPSPWQVPSKAAGTGGWFAQLSMAHALLGRSAGGGWRGPEAKTREDRPMIACEMLDARKRGELLLP